MTVCSQGAADAAPVGRDEFAALMAPLGPFEPRPSLAVAVSGGADSLALALLLHGWARARRGRVLALTVDHGLRPDAAAEARFVARTLKPLGIEHQVLRWRGPKPGGSIPALARQARYDLLIACCARHGLLHLVLGHHLDDQAETLLLRLGRGSGLDGLAAMAPAAELPALRLLRPLLTIPKARLQDTLRTRGLAWVEDPSNQDPSQARVRWRRLQPELAGEGLTPERLAATAGHLGRARAALDWQVARLLARAIMVHPAGFAQLDADALLTAPEETGLRALARILMTIGGAPYPARFERLSRLYARLSGGLERPATLGGCRILPRRGRVLVVLENRDLAEIPVRPGTWLRWDGRFDIHIHPRAGRQGARMTLGALGPAGWAEVRRSAPELAASPIPAPARAVLPALRDSRRVLAVPYLGYKWAGSPVFAVKKCRFRPENAVTASAFTVA